MVLKKLLILGRHHRTIKRFVAITQQSQERFWKKNQTNCWLKKNQRETIKNQSSSSSVIFHNCNLPAVSDVQRQVRVRECWNLTASQQNTEESRLVQEISENRFFKGFIDENLWKDWWKEKTSLLIKRGFLSWWEVERFFLMSFTREVFNFQEKTEKTSLEVRCHPEGTGLGLELKMNWLDLFWLKRSLKSPPEPAVSF